MAERKIYLEMSNSDWGKVAVAVQHELNAIRNRKCGSSPEQKLRRACEVSNMARIKDQITIQRRAIRYGHVTDQSVSKCQNGHLGPMSPARRQTADKRSWIDGEWCQSCQTYVFPSQDVAA